MKGRMLPSAATGEPAKDRLWRCHNRSEADLARMSASSSTRGLRSARDKAGSSHAASVQYVHIVGLTPAQRSCGRPYVPAREPLPVEQEAPRRSRVEIVVSTGALLKLRAPINRLQEVGRIRACNAHTVRVWLIVPEPAVDVTDAKTHDSVCGARVYLEACGRARQKQEKNWNADDDRGHTAPLVAS